MTQFLHAALLVADLATSEQFYSGVLGLPKVDRPLNYPGLWYQLGDIQIHLIVDPTFTAKFQQSEKWGRNPHLAIGVSDLAAMKANLSAQGYPFQLSASGRSALFVCDPDGNVIELSESPSPAP